MSSLRSSFHLPFFPCLSYLHSFPSFTLLLAPGHPSLLPSIPSLNPFPFSHLLSVTSSLFPSQSRLSPFYLIPPFLLLFFFFTFQPLAFLSVLHFSPTPDLPSLGPVIHLPLRQNGYRSCVVTSLSWCYICQHEDSRARGEYIHARGQHTK